MASVGRALRLGSPAIPHLPNASPERLATNGGLSEICSDSPPTAAERYTFQRRECRGVQRFEAQSCTIESTTVSPMRSLPSP